MLKISNASLAFLGVVALAGLPQVSLGAEATAENLGTVPNADTSHPSGLDQGDEWEITVFPNQNITLSVDTRDDTGNLESLLDPVLILKDKDENVLARGDDGVECSRAPVCGFSCPSFDYTVPPNSAEFPWWGTKLTVVVRDFNGITLTDEECSGGSYNLRMEVDGTSAGATAASLKLVNDDGAVNDPPWLQEVLEAEKGQ